MLLPLLNGGRGELQAASTRHAMKRLVLLSIPLLLAPVFGSCAPMFGVSDQTHAGSCTRFYVPRKNACGTTADSTLRMATTQSGTGSPHMGLMPTMKTLAP